MKLTQSHYISQLFGLTYDEKYFINKVIACFAQGMDEILDVRQKIDSGNIADIN